MSYLPPMRQRRQPKSRGPRAKAGRQHESKTEQNASSSSRLRHGSLRAGEGEQSIISRELCQAPSCSLTGCLELALLKYEALRMSAAEQGQDADPEVTTTTDEQIIQEGKPLWSPTGNFWKDFLFFSGPGWSVILCTWCLSC